MSLPTYLKKKTGCANWPSIPASFSWAPWPAAFALLLPFLALFPFLFSSPFLLALFLSFCRICFVAASRATIAATNPGLTASLENNGIPNILHATKMFAFFSIFFFVFYGVEILDGWLKEYTLWQYLN